MYECKWKLLPRNATSLDQAWHIYRYPLHGDTNTDG